MKSIPTVTLKWLTTSLLLVALILMLAGPLVVRRPRGTGARSYLARIALYGGVLGLAAVGAGIGAYVILRREQAFYREKAMENMKSLIEATRQEELRKKEATKPSGIPRDDDVPADDV